MKRISRCLSLCSVIAVVLGVTTSAGASVRTDRWVYTVGDTVRITGDGMSAGEAVGVGITYPDATIAQDHTVIADTSGMFRDTYVVRTSDPAGIYRVTATGFTSGHVFTTTFDPNAIFTTDEDCLQVDGNIYPSKAAVYLNGGPHGGSGNGGLDDGDYYVRVTNPSGATILGESATAVVTVSGGSFVDCYQLAAIVVSPTTGQLGYDNTPNNGLEYKVWVSMDPTFPNSETKTDNFKAPPDRDCTEDCGGTEASAPTILKTAAGSFDTTYTWSILKGVNKTRIQQAGGNATFNYTADVSHGPGVTSNVTVTGTIALFNTNAGSIAITGVEDELSDGTACSLVAAAPASLPPGLTTLHYSCDLGALPTGNLSNTATVTWPTQQVDGAELLGTSASTEPFPVAFIGEDIDECVVVNDTLVAAGAPDDATVCVGDANPTEYEYSRTVPVPESGCQSYGNTADFVTNDTETPGDSSQTVQACAPNTSTITTALKAHDGSDVALSGHVPLGTKMHDTASVTASSIPAGSSVGFTFYTNDGCESGSAIGTASFTAGTATSNETAALGAGSYSFRANFTSGDPDQVAGSTSDCEPFVVDQARTSIRTSVRDAAGNDITNGYTYVGTAVRDTSTISGGVAGFPITGTVTYNFYTDAACTVVASPPSDTVAVGSPSAVRTPTAAGGYCFRATYNGDANYRASSPSEREPFTVSLSPCARQINVRWHYADGTSGSWSGTKTVDCTGKLTMGPQAMEGDLKVKPGTTLRMGYDFTMPGGHPASNVVFANVEYVFPYTCTNGLPGGTLIVNDSNNENSANLDQAYFDPANSSAWYPSGDQKSNLVYQGAKSLAGLCGGTGTVRFQKGGTFTAQIFVTN